MATRCGELVATDEPTVVAKSLLNAIVMEHRQSDRCLPDSTNTNESNWDKVFRQPNNFIYQMVTSEAGSRRRGWGFSRHAKRKYEILDPLATRIADLA